MFSDYIKSVDPEYQRMEYQRRLDELSSMISKFKVFVEGRRKDDPDDMVFLTRQEQIKREINVLLDKMKKLGPAAMTPKTVRIIKQAIKILDTVK